jgi:glycosyltransferase involved in cell wall biosynthesis
MKIALVGPTHPYKGGIVLHTTELAHRLTKAGHSVEIVSWRTQYPFFYPGTQFVPGNKPELPPFPQVKRVLSWKNPFGWWQWGRHLRSFDEVVFAWWVPTIQGPVYLSLLRALGKHRPRTAIICHNVLPHEPRAGDKWLARAVLSRADQVIVHTDEQAEIARHLTQTPVRVIKLPFSLPPVPPRSQTLGARLTRHLLFFGLVRPYKGLDVLLRALVNIPEVRLTVAGEFWGSITQYEALVEELHLKERVELRNEYISADDLAALLSACDAVVLPYRQGTATWNTTLAFSYGAPVIATTAGSLASQVRDGVDGVFCRPDDVESLTRAIQRFYEPGVAKKLRAGVPKVTTDADWDAYVEAVTKN